MYQYKTLSNGIKVVAEKIDYLKSISIGVWVGNGSRYENKEVNGISHFIEHMLFKGTKNRSAAQIAHEIDSVGGQLDAFTSREYTCFYTKTLDSHIPIALEILSDMLYNPSLSPDDMALERQVIKEEIRMRTVRKILCMTFRHTPRGATHLWAERFSAHTKVLTA